MSKWLTIICILALAAFICAPAFAEVQNVKVSGDIAVRSILRDNYTLDKDTAKSEASFMQSVGLNIDADLTDNVSTSVRLVNQRDWDNNSDVGTPGAQTNAFSVDLDLAYVTLKEMIYAPLTLTIGRQGLWFGRGLIVGANLQDFNGSIVANEYTETSAFDAIKATLDLAPWKLDLLYSKIDENTIVGATGLKDDVDLYGVNAGYKFDQYNAEAEAYYFGKFDDSSATNGQLNVNTYGLRGSLEPVENLTIGAEGALQNGRHTDTLNAQGMSIKAYAYDLYGKYKFTDVQWTPTLGVEWLSLSGEKNGSTTSTWNGWDVMYRGKFDTAIRDFQNVYYATAARATAALGQDTGVSNQNSLLITGSIVPTEDVTVQGTYGHFWLNENLDAATRGALKSGTEVGDELDLLLTYDYTEDVSFGLLTGWFFPGKIFPSGQDDVATDVVGTMKVVF